MNSIYFRQALAGSVPAELPSPDSSRMDAFERTARQFSGAPATYHFDETIAFGRIGVQGLAA